MPLVQAHQAGVDVAAQRFDPQVRVVHAQLSGPADGAGADHRAVGQLGQRCAGAGDHGVVDVLARQVPGEGQAVGDGDVAGDVLEAVHREVGLLGEQRAVDLLDERALAAELGQVAHPPVAGGGDLDQFGADGRVECLCRAARRPARPGARPSGWSGWRSGSCATWRLPYDSSSGGQDKPAGPVHQCDLESGLGGDLGEKSIHSRLVVVGPGRLWEQVVTDVETAEIEVAQQVGAAVELAGPAVDEHQVEAGSRVGVRSRRRRRRPRATPVSRHVGTRRMERSSRRR